MDAEALRTEYEGLRTKKGGLVESIPKLVVRRIIVEADPLSGIDKARAAVTPLENEAEGWSRRASWVGRTPIADGETRPESSDIPFDGEWKLSETESCRLVYDGGERWRLITIRELEPGADDRGGGEVRNVLREDTSLIANGLAGGAARLSYAVYWGAPREIGADGKPVGKDGERPPGIRRLAARFLGFDIDRKA